MLNVEILCNPTVKTSNVGFPNISGESSKDFLQSIQEKSSNMVQSPHFLIITNSETGYWKNTLFAQWSHGAYLHPGLWTRFGVLIPQIATIFLVRKQEILTNSNRFQRVHVFPTVFLSSFSMLILQYFHGCCQDCTLEKSVACSMFRFRPCVVYPFHVTMIELYIELKTKQEWEFSVGWTYRLLPHCA